MFTYDRDPITNSGVSWREEGRNRICTNISEISGIRETLNVSTDASRSTDTQKKHTRNFTSSLGDLVKRGWAAVHSTSEPWFTFYPLNYTAPISYAVHFTEKF